MGVTLTLNGNPFKGVDLGNQAALENIVVEVVNQAKILVPVNFGQLRNTIMGEVENLEYGHDGGDKIKESPKKGEAYVGSAASYAAYQEFGTKYMAPQPYLRPAISLASGQSSQSVMNKIMIEEMLGALKEGQKRVNF